MNKKNSAIAVPQAPVIPMGTMSEMTDLDQQIAILQAKTAEANKAIAELIERKNAKDLAEKEHRKAQIMAMPGIIGLTTLTELIAAIYELEGAPVIARGRVDDVKRDLIKKSLADGMTAAKCAELYKLSIATINIIKKEAGLVKSRTVHV